MGENRWIHVHKYQWISKRYIIYQRMSNRWYASLIRQDRFNVDFNTADAAMRYCDSQST